MVMFYLSSQIEACNDSRISSLIICDKNTQMLYMCSNGNRVITFGGYGRRPTTISLTEVKCLPTCSVTPRPFPCFQCTWENLLKNTGKARV